MQPLPKIRFGIRVQDVPMDWGMGFVLTICITAMILISLPEARVLFALSLPTGITVGLILYLIHRRPPRRERILSLHLRNLPDDRAGQPRMVTHPRTPSASGIRMEKISPVGEMGLVFTIGAMAAMALILVSLPEAHEVFAWSFPAGILVGLILYLIHRRPPRRERVMSLHLQDVPDHRAASPTSLPTPGPALHRTSF
jgi:xanthosine utilization system XapX-like protein